MGWLITAPLPWDSAGAQAHVGCAARAGALLTPGIKRDGGSRVCPTPTHSCQDTALSHHPRGRRWQGPLGDHFVCIPGERSQAQSCRAQSKNHPKQAANYSPLLKVEGLWIGRALIQRLIRSLPRIQDTFQKETKISVFYFKCHLPHRVKSLTLWVCFFLPEGLHPASLDSLLIFGYVNTARSKMPL